MPTSGYVGTAIRVNITLASPPAAGAPHTVAFTGPQANPGDVSLSPESMTFDSSNWSTAQILSVVPKRAGTIPIDYEISSSYTARKKVSSFNVTANPMPMDTPVWSGGGYSAYIGGVVQNGGGFSLQVLNTNVNNTLSVSVSGGISGTHHIELTAPDGSVTTSTSFVSTLNQLGMYQWRIGMTPVVGNTPSESAAVTAASVTGPSNRNFTATVSRSGYTSGAVSTTGPEAILMYYNPGNYSPGGGAGDTRDSGANATSDSWTLPFKWISQGDGVWEAEVTSFNMSPVNMVAVSPNGTIDATSDATGSFTNSNPGTTPITTGISLTFDLFYDGNLMVSGGGFYFGPWKIYTGP